ncbi:hypothetical protein [Clostridiisalibacter paucivorans]|uniref:hypothetical protein n=1 Tax=Clostridiisalibacter paucivorans TaxID=408753 RepID=UPI00047D1C31|nr:hypothetical protein [Clostridiisalibacter paucivorans]
MSNGFNDPSPGEAIIDQGLEYITETVCIITDKVYAHCQQRECFANIDVDLNEGEFSSIKFRPGFIEENTLIVTDLENRPNFKRVQFTLKVPYEITKKDGSTITGFLPDIRKDIVLFIPSARDEFDFRIVVETSSSLLNTPTQSNGIVSLAVGVFVIVKVVGRVQLLIPAYGFCPEPPECEEFSPDKDICEEFEYRPFPDFFPPQFEDIYPDV